MEEKKKNQKTKGDTNPRKFKGGNSGIVRLIIWN
nr:MAG TPA: hypothetical protein [Caudoviricetes sp.]